MTYYERFLLAFPVAAANIWLMQPRSITDWHFWGLFFISLGVADLYITLTRHGWKGTQEIVSKLLGNSWEQAKRWSNYE